MYFSIFVFEYGGVFYGDVAYDARDAGDVLVFLSADAVCVDVICGDVVFFLHVSEQTFSGVLCCNQINAHNPMLEICIAL